MRTAVLTISTSVAAARREDEAGPLLARLAEEAGADVDAMEVVPGRLRASSRTACTTTSTTAYAFVFTTGGTGLTPDDVTPEATKRRDRARRARASPRRCAPPRLRAHPDGRCSSRGVAGIAERTLIVNFPGSPRAIEQLFGVLAPVLAPRRRDAGARGWATPAAIELEGLTRRYGERRRARRT